jgi:cytochrome c-type biogenesis protein CcmH
MQRFLIPIIFALVYWPAMVQAGDYVFDPETEPTAQQVFSAVSSPFCPGRMLKDCPSSGASELKNEIRSLVLEGNSSTEVIALLYERYGDQIRAVPDDSFFGRLAWLLPALFLFLGAVVILLWLYSKKKQAVSTILESSGSFQQPVDQVLKAQIEEELKRF